MQHQGVLLTNASCYHFPSVRDGNYYTFWVYIMGSRTGTLYTGMTGFFDRRVDHHKTGAIEGFTKKYACHRLLYYEKYGDIGQAKRRERQIKGWRREKKVALIEKSSRCLRVSVVDSLRC